MTYVQPYRSLAEVETGGKAFIADIQGNGAFRRRIGEMGFVRGREITVVKNAPFNDPVEFSVMGYNVSLRRNEAALIAVHVLPTGLLPDNNPYVESIVGETGKHRHSRPVRIALVGNPNSGKTTLFNQATRSREHVGNYAGVTVEAKTMRVKFANHVLEITDLPGTYSLSAYSPEELFVREFLIAQKPDVVINIIDATNLERNLLLTTQLIDMRQKVVVALNMFDEMVSNHDRFHYNTLGRMLGIPFVPTVGTKGRGIDRLFATAVDVFAGTESTCRPVSIHYDPEMEQSIRQILANLRKFEAIDDSMGMPARFVAICLLARDRHIEKLLSDSPHFRQIAGVVNSEITRVETLMGRSTDTLITDARYGFIAGALKETYVPGLNVQRKMSERIDRFLTHRIFGFPIFLLFLWVTFMVTFAWGNYPKQWIESGVTLLGLGAESILPAGSFRQLVTDGIIGGVGGVIVFLPNILLLFLFISFMEDTGYMARAAFITDRLMHVIGLHGRSFIPLIMGFGCNVPAIMATRTIENRNNRLLTMLLNPFMTCSARLPVYILLIGAVFPGYKGTVLLAIYLSGIIMAVLTGLLFKKTLFRTSDAPFVMELPPYRMPTIRSTLRHMWNKASQYLRKMGGVILVASILIWALGQYPVQKDLRTQFELQKTELKTRYDRQVTDKVLPPEQVSALRSALDAELAAADRELRVLNQQHSFLGRTGQFIEPVIQPLGFDWRMGICLLTGVTAKEIVVSTMGVIYKSPDDENSSTRLTDRISLAVHDSGPKAGQRVFTRAATLAFMIFTLLYFPCIATLAAIYRESGSWKWAAFSLAYTSVLAWVMAFIVYNIAGFLFN